MSVLASIHPARDGHRLLQIARAQATQPAVELDLHSDGRRSRRRDVRNETLAPGNRIGASGERHGKLLRADRAHHQNRTY
jgi:hypothetical protein